MVFIFKNDACLAETFPLLFCFSITNTARKTQMQLQKIHKRSCTAFRKLMCV